MAKTRAQRKAEKRRRQEAQRRRQPGRPEDELRDENAAQRDTREGVSGDVAEAEAVIETGARTEDYGEHVGDAEPPRGEAQPRSAAPGVTPEPVAPEPVAPEPPEPPAPSRADIGRPEPSDAAPGETREQRRARRRAERQREKEEKRRTRQRELQKAQEQKAEKRRGGVIGFFASCWAELKRVQWPDRDTLVQASAVTIVFVAVMAAYLGALDAAFNWLIQRII
ncbi:MAG: preprotein translocase subunit SecE [Solirubrobacterales bacterium]